MTASRVPIVRFGLAACLALGALWLAQPLATQAQQPSACLDCHEIQGQNRVLTSGPWHIQHGESDLCAVCHGGNPAAVEKDAAHAGAIRNPLTEAETRCALCHSGDYTELAAGLWTQIPPTPTETPAPPTATPVPGASPAPPATATPVPAPPVPPAPPSGWLAVLAFARGPLFKTAFYFFAAGMLVRLLLLLQLGWKHRRSPNKPGGLLPVLISYARGLLIFPFLPTSRRAFRRSPGMYIAGGMFHLGLLGVILFTSTHVMAWKEVLGFGWPALPKGFSARLAAIGLVGMLGLLINRLADPVLRLISRAAEWLNWSLVFIPMATGFLLARRLWLPYEAMFSIHMLAVDLLLIWIPLSRISHFMFYFLARAIHGLEFERRVSVGGD